MNDNDLKVYVEAAIDIQKSKNNVNAGIKEIEKQANTIQTKIVVDSKSAQQAMKQQQDLINKNAKDYNNYLNDLAKEYEARDQRNIDSRNKRLKQTTSKEGLKFDKEKLEFDIQDLMKNSRVAKEFGGDLDNITSKIKKADKAQLQNLRKEFQVTKKHADNLGYTTDTLGEKFKKNFAQLANFLTVSTAVMGSIHIIKRMIDTVTELDKAATDIRMVIGGTAQDTEKLMMSYNALGKEIGATTVEVATSANEYLRQGKSIEETNQLIRDTMTLSKISMMSSADATTYMTAALKGYKLASSEALNVADKLSQVDTISATSAAGLALGMSKTASSANMAGVSMDKLLGILATIGEVTQDDMSSIGESMKTMFARMGNIKLGKLIDDETGESLSDVETILGRIGVKLRINDTEFRNFGDVLDEVGKKFNTLSGVDKSATATAIAGVRQREKFLVLMQNYNNVLKYTEESTNSAGKATEKMGVYNESAESKAKKFQSTLEALSKTILDSSLIKGIIDSGSGVVSVLTSITKKLGAIPTLIGAITLAMSAMGKNAGKDMPPYLKVA